VHEENHPLIILYQETVKMNFPLILFVGREPNNKVPYINEAGLYDFLVRKR